MAGGGMFDIGSMIEGATKSGMSIAGLALSFMGGQKTKGYRDAIHALRNARKKSLGALEGYGAQSIRDVDTNVAEQISAIRQSLASRGLANSSLLSSMSAGAIRRKFDTTNSIKERLAAMRASIWQNSGNALAGVMQQRPETGVNAATMAALGSGLGGGAASMAQAFKPQPAIAGSPGTGIDYGALRSSYSTAPSVDYNYGGPGRKVDMNGGPQYA